MKKCFTFKCYADCREAAKFLQTVIPSTVHSRLDNNIVVADDMYEHAIVQGMQFVKKFDCNWVDDSGNEVPINMAPFAIISLKDYIVQPNCLAVYSFPSITHFATFAETLFERKVFIQIRSNSTIAFLIQISHDKYLEHSTLVEKIKEKSIFLNDSIFDNVVFTNIYGATIL